VLPAIVTKREHEPECQALLSRAPRRRRPSPQYRAARESGSNRMPGFVAPSMPVGQHSSR